MRGPAQAGGRLKQLVAKPKGAAMRRPAFNAFGQPKPSVSAGRPVRGGPPAQQFMDDEEDAFVPVGLRSGRVPPAPRRGGGKAYGVAVQAPPPPPSLDEVFGQVHAAIHNAVWEPVQQIMHLETNWAEADVAKRIVKYMSKAACDEKLLALEWYEICELLCKALFATGYSASCGQCEWFYEIDLAPPITAAVMVLFPAAGWQVSAEQAFDVCSLVYQAQLDRIIFEKATWEMCESLFGDDEKVRSKVYNAISRAHEPALNRVLADATPQEEITRMETFVRNWIDDSCCRAWGGLHDQAAEVLNQESLVQMFDHLLQPFGDAHPFSAIPRVLTDSIGEPPPPGWDFIPQAVEELLEKWANDANMPSRKRKKKVKDEDAPSDQEEEVEEAVARPKQAARQLPAAKDVKLETTGHPDCTSGEDCAGTPEDGLVQHVVEEGAGDLYCEVCWKSFTARNPELEGVPVEL